MRHSRNQRSGGGVARLRKFHHPLLHAQVSDGLRLEKAFCRIQENMSLQLWWPGGHKRCLVPDPSLRLLGCSDVTCIHRAGKKRRIGRPLPPWPIMLYSKGFDGSYMSTCQSLPGHPNASEMLSSVLILHLSDSKTVDQHPCQQDPGAAPLSYLQPAQVKDELGLQHPAEVPKVFSCRLRDGNLSSVESVGRIQASELPLNALKNTTLDTH